MKIGLHVSLAVLLGFVLLWGLRACSPFGYIMEGEPLMLHGGVSR